MSSALVLDQQDLKAPELFLEHRLHNGNAHQYPEDSSAYGRYIKNRALWDAKQVPSYSKHETPDRPNE